MATDVSSDGGLVLTAPSNRVWSRGAPGHYSSDLGTNVHASFGGAVLDGATRIAAACRQAASSWRQATKAILDHNGCGGAPSPSARSDTVGLHGEREHLSRDGRSMTGMGTTEIYSGYDEFVWRWCDGVGTECLPLNVGERPRAILADGSVIVSLPLPSGGVQAGRWMLYGSLIETGIPCFDVMSDDGAVFAAGGLVWTQATGVTTLEALAGPGVLPAGGSRSGPDPRSTTGPRVPSSTALIRARGIRLREC